MRWMLLVIEEARTHYLKKMFLISISSKQQSWSFPDSSSLLCAISQPVIILLNLWWCNHMIKCYSRLLFRALIAAVNIKSVDSNPNILGIKRTSGFVRACSEMSRHQELVQRAARVGFEKSISHRSDSEERDELSLSTDRKVDFQLLGHSWLG